MNILQFLRTLLGCQDLSPQLDACTSTNADLCLQLDTAQAKLADALSTLQSLQSTIVSLEYKLSTKEAELEETITTLTQYKLDHCLLTTIPFWAMIIKHAVAYGLDPFLVAGLLERESAWDTLVPGDGGASIGLAQVGAAAWGDMMPETKYERARSPDEAILFACRYLRYLRDWLILEWDVEDEKYMLGTYNTGPGNMAATLRQYGENWSKVPDQVRNNVAAYYSHINRLKVTCSPLER